jgi:cyclomaltodextrinase
MDIKTPDWVKSSVFYQIFPDRFAKIQDAKPGLWQPENLEPWDSSPTPQGYKGGDLWGVIEKLDYLQELGVNAIYFTPIFQSASNHRYHTHDYYQVDPMLGGNIAFDAFLDAAHQRDIKVVLDGVFNHASRGFFFFNDILENGSHSPWVDWFRIIKWPLSPYDGSKPANYISWWDIRALPQFNHDNPQVKEYIMQIGEYWVKKGIDGWRLDVPNEIETPGFWQEFRTRIKAINPDAYIVGEIWKDARQWLDGTQFDGVMNYLLTETILAFVGGDRLLEMYVETAPYNPYPPLNAKEYAKKIQKLLSLYSWEIQLTQMNLLDSHDTARYKTIVGEDPQSIELATLLLFTFPGAPSIYYGDEIGLAGGLDPDCRRSFPSENQWDLDVLNYHKKLINLRRYCPALCTGEYKFIFANKYVYVFARTLEQQTLMIAVNISDQTQEVLLDLSQTVNFNGNQVLYGDIEYYWVQSERHLKLILPARSGGILE